MSADMYVLCVYDRENSRNIMHGIGEGSEGTKMIRDGYGRVTKCAVVEIKKMTCIMTPKPSIQSTTKTQKQSITPTPTQSILMQNKKIRKINIKVQGHGETHPLEAVYNKIFMKKARKTYSQSPWRLRTPMITRQRRGTGRLAWGHQAKTTTW